MITLGIILYLVMAFAFALGDKDNHHSFIQSFGIGLMVILGIFVFVIGVLLAGAMALYMMLLLFMGGHWILVNMP